MFYSIIYHRKSKGAIPAHFHESTKVEIAWTVVPFLILICMAVPATSTLLAIYNTDDAELDILITGYQWKWKYEYISESGENVSFFSNLRTPQSEIYNSEPKGEHYLLEVDEPMVIPVNSSRSSTMRARGSFISYSAATKFMNSVAVSFSYRNGRSGMKPVMNFALSGSF